VAISLTPERAIDGRFGPYGGRYVPETLVAALEELSALYDGVRADPAFWAEIAVLLRDYVGRPTPLTEAPRLGAAIGARLLLKREDLNHTGAHKINNTVGQALLAQRMGKRRIIAETGAGQHGVATATICARLGLECVVYMGAEDVARQALNVYRMRLLGATVVPVDSGTRTLKDATNEALRDWVANVPTTHYVIGSVVGPDPYPRMVRDFQSVIGREARAQVLERTTRLPHTVVACVGGGSNAIGIFSGFLDGAEVSLVGVEAAGEGIESGRHSATLLAGLPGVLHGALSYLLQDADGQVAPAHSVSAGLDYPGVGPEHAWLHDAGRVEYHAVDDRAALDGFSRLARLEGIIPALESAHAVAHARKLAPTLTRDAIVLTRAVPLPKRHAIGTEADPVMLEVFNNLFMSIAEQMGVVLQNTAYSVNIKERLDFSCAVFDGDARLVANAPHMPVHLGSMSESIKTVMRENAGKIVAGDAYVINDPYHGGTHLPDITVITPVFDRGGFAVLFYVGSRGHHADIGGITPGSMPPFSQTLDDEGVRFINFRLVEGRGADRPGRFRETELMALLNGGTYPARNPAQNVADLRAQIAANEKGREELLRMVDQFGLDVVRAYMKHVQDNAEESVRRVITSLTDGAFEYRLDNGAVICVLVTVDRERRSATIDFTGTSDQLPNNFNAPSAVCVAAVLYVFRTLVDDMIPLNAGCLKPLDIIIPRGSMLNPDYPAAVVAGNVETSSCITNALYGALGVMASAQGTMNNFTFGNDRYQYYETISGGSGAGVANLQDTSSGFDGTDVVQTHMTNSRLTDPEVLEVRYPVLLESYAIRRGSGGDGRWRGGSGGTRRVRFLEKMTASILANNRSIAPFGMAGGKAGAPGRNWVERVDGSREKLPHIGSAEMMPGDVFVVETPGGGGFGTPD